MLLQSLVVIVRGSAQEGKERARQRLALEAVRGPGLMGKGGRMGLIKEVVMKKYT